MSAEVRQGSRARTAAVRGSVIENLGTAVCPAFSG
jgi:hypothetical protein